MRKVILSIVCLLNLCYSEQLKIIPIDKSLLSQENGGNKTAIDAYSDGIGIITESNQLIDNSPMNILVYTYGEKAKESGDTLKNFSLDNGNNKEIVLAEKLGTLNNLEGTSCDDGNAGTINDKYLNGICVGEEKTVNVSYFILKNAIWPSTYKMFGLMFSINDKNILKGETNFISKGVLDDSIFIEDYFGFYENKVTGELASMNIKPVKISLTNPIKINQYSDIKIEYISGAFWYNNQRLNGFTIEFYTDKDELISSKTYSGLENGIRTNNTGIYYCRVLNSTCPNYVDELIPNQNLNLKN